MAPGLVWILRSSSELRSLQDGAFFFGRSCEETMGISHVSADVGKGLRIAPDSARCN
jgi:hypothetical protein